MSGARTGTTIAASETDRRALDWERAYILHAPALLRFVRRLIGDADAAEELMQDTFERAFRANAAPDPAALRPWLYRIAANVVTDQLRRRRLIAFLPFSGHERDPRQHFDHERDSVRDALRAIAPEEAVALVLRLHEGFSRAEIAQLTGVSERQVKDRLERGRESFARAYRGEESR